MAIKYLAGNRITGTFSDRTGLASGVTDYLNDGTLWLELVTNDMYKWDKAADGWELVTGNLIAENLSGKTFTDYLLVAERSAPGSSVGSGKGAFYVDSNGVFYGKFENETPVNLGQTTGATTLAGLSDVTLGGITLAAGHLMVYSGSAWLNKSLAGATGTTATLNASGELGITALTVLTDLDLTVGNKTIFDTVGANTITFAHSSTQTTFPGNVTVSGDFTVSGATTTVSTTNSVISDNLIELNNGAGSNANDSGIVIERGSTGDNAIMAWDESADGFIVGTTAATGTGTGNLTIAAAPFQAAAITGTTGTFAGLANNAGALTTNNKVVIDVTNSALPSTLSADGQLLHIDALTFTDGSTSASGTASQNYASVNLDQATLAASNSSVTTTRAATLNIAGAPAAGTNMTLTDTYALYVAGGATHLTGAVTAGAAVTVTGTLTASAAATVGTTLTVTGAATFNGAVTLGDATGDAITVTGRIANGAVLPVNTNQVDLGGASNQYKNLYVVGTAYLDTLDANAVIPTPKITTALLDSAGDEMIKFTPSGGTTVNELTVTNTAANGSPSIAATGTDTNIGLTLQGKGTGASAVVAGGATGACIEFNTKYTGGNPSGDESARLYLKEVDANNNALAVRIFKANAYQEVEITSPKAICGECGSNDGAKDPTYDFSRSMMVVDLWCGHSYEVPMTGWNVVN